LVRSPTINAISNAIDLTFNIPVIATSVVLTIVVALVTLGGIKSIAKVSEIVVPFMAVFYVIGALFIIARNYTLLPETFGLVIRSAFTPAAATGGFLGASVMFAMRNGVRP